MVLLRNHAHRAFLKGNIRGWQRNRAVSSYSFAFLDFLLFNGISLLVIYVRKQLSRRNVNHIYLNSLCFIFPTFALYGRYFLAQKNAEIFRFQPPPNINPEYSMAKFVIDKREKKSWKYHNVFWNILFPSIESIKNALSTEVGVSLW